MAEVQRVLGDIGAADIQQVLVFNKADKLEDGQLPRSASDVLELEGGVRVPRVFVSALDGRGLPELRRILSSAVAGTLQADLNSMPGSSIESSTTSGAPLHDSLPELPDAAA